MTSPNKSGQNRTATAHTRRRYNFIAPFYDVMEGIMERALYTPWRRRFWNEVKGPRVLEIGVGTGKNLPYHRDEIEVCGIDLSENMLARARKKAASMNYDIDLQIMDAQHLQFPDGTFDAVAATFVFCSVPDPVRGLQEALRVTKPGGNLYLLEHMLARPAFLARVMTWLDRPVHWLTGVHIARRTVDNVRAAGWQIDRVESLSAGSIYRLIRAQKSTLDPPADSTYPMTNPTVN